MHNAQSPIDALAAELTARDLVCTIDCPLALMVPMSDLPFGASATVVAYKDPQSVLCRRLFDLGFHPGLEVSLVRRAPLRDPLVFAVANSEIVLRKRDAAQIMVRLGEEMNQ